MMALKIGDFVDPVDVAMSGPLDVPLPQRWYLLRVHPNKETKVMRAFDLRHISAYLPTITKHRGARDIATPLFPGLVFIPDFECGQSRLRDVDGVAGLLQFGPWTPYLTPSLLSDVRKIAATGNMPLSKVKRLYAIGDPVRIVDGPFSGWQGRIERLDSKGRIKVLLAALKRGQLVQMTESQIEPAPTATAAGTSRQ